MERKTCTMSDIENISTTFTKDFQNVKNVIAQKY